jgi:integrase
VSTLPKYKYGKITAPIDFQAFKEAMENGNFAKGKKLSHKSFLSFLYWFGVRKAEALERRKEDFLIKDGLLIVDATPKKGGEREPLEVPVSLPYVDFIVENVKQTRRNPRDKEGRVWNFSPRTAINIVKRAMGDRYYPHFFRLNRATRFLEDPTTTLPEMKAWFGWKAAKTVDPYIGYSRRHIRRQRERLERELGETG